MANHASPEATAGELCRVIAQAHRRGWCLGTSGNFSVALETAPARLLITPSGRDKGRLSPDDLLVVDGEGRPVGGPGRPSAETLVHLALVESAGAGAVLHTHSVAGTVLSRRLAARGAIELEGYEMLKGLAGITTHATRVAVPIVANTQEMPALADTVRRLAAEVEPLYGFLVEGHGLTTWGATLGEAERHLEILEFLLDCELAASVG